MNTQQTNKHYKAQATIQALLDELTSSGRETGLQVAAYLNGELAVAAQSGWMDANRYVPLASDALFLSFSCAKGLTATVIHQLVADGALSYDTPVAELWPEFAAHGKQAITLRQVLTHQAGVPHLPHRLSFARLCNPQLMRNLVADAKPLWHPGQDTGYHAITQGVILGAVIEAATGKAFSEVVQSLICRPLGLSDSFFGVPERALSRIARPHGPTPPWAKLPPVLRIHQAIPVTVTPGKKWDRPDAYRAVMPASNLVTSARDLARFYASLCPAGVDGHRLLTPERVGIATALQTSAPDRVLRMRLNKSLGFWLGGSQGKAFGPRLNVFGHSGAGGSIGLADPEYSFSFALLKNKMSWGGPEEADLRVVTALRKALDLPD